MATYAIGDIQGCYEPLRALLRRVRFSPDRDRLYLVGDLVARGPASLETLRFVRGLGDAAVTVLGNHDLSLLATFAAGEHERAKASLKPVLFAPDRNPLMEWLRGRPLLHHDPELAVTLVHAGLPPQWDLDTARRCAAELEAVLAGPDYPWFLAHMYGNEPERWSPDLAGIDRLRFITNALTRMRFCTADGRLDMQHNGPPGSQPEGLMPWFEVPGRANADLTIVFGHWARLGGVQRPGVYGIDTGCVWGGALTALRLDPPDDDGRPLAIREACAD